jgi:hypothetical protein
VVNEWYNVVDQSDAIEDEVVTHRRLDLRLAARVWSKELK